METEILRRTIRSHNGRNGYVTSKDRDFRLELAIPKEMGGAGDQTKTNPEELFAAGYSSCFSSSLQYMMQVENVESNDFYAEATTKLVKDDQHGGFKFSVIMKASIKGVDEKTKKDIIDKAYQFCPYSRAIRGNIDVKIIIE
mgnify:CR=1 FL=1|jgi:osmotically inducible protein OsmC